MANKNKNLNDAAKAKKDEFYTQLEDIERELNHEEYREFFKGKTVLCNCDDPYESEFFKYFAMNFNALELKKLIVTCYAGSPVAQTELNFDDGGTIDKKHRNEYAYKVVINEFKDWNGDGREDLEDIKQYILTHRGSWERLKGNGDFRSAECIKILKAADVVVTNPPFSLFREYVAQLMQYEKKFVIIGNINSITYKEIFPLIQQNKIHIGYGMGRAISGFMVPEYYGLYGTEAGIDEDGKRKVATNQCLWYTNIPLKKYLEEIPLVCSYYENPEKYPHYDNYDAIEVSKTAQIPYDYLPSMDLTNTDENEHNIYRTVPYRTVPYRTDEYCSGVMGVPISFIDRYNSNQFEIVGCSYQYGDPGVHVKGTTWNAQINGKDIYKRLFIRRKM